MNKEIINNITTIFERINHRGYKASTSLILAPLEKYYLNNGPSPKLVFRDYWEKSLFNEVLRHVGDKLPEKTIDLILSDENKNNQKVKEAFEDIFPKHYQQLPYLLENYQWFINSYLQKLATNFDNTANYYQLLFHLSKIVPEKYEPKLVAFFGEYLSYFTDENKLSKNDRTHFRDWREGWGTYDNENRKQDKRLSIQIFNHLEERLTSEAFQEKLKYFCINTFFFPTSTLAYIKEKLGTDAMPYLAKAFEQNSKYLGNTYFKQLIEISSDLDWLPFSDTIWKGMSTKDLQSQLEVTRLLASNIDDAIAHANTYIKQKGSKRLLAFFVLTQIENEEALAMMTEAYQTEVNDKQREIMKPTAIRNIYKKEMSITDVNNILALAKKRKKLDKWEEKTFQEKDLPKLFLKTGEALTSDQIRFLFYRMRQVKTMQSDPEAKFLLNLIDTEKSNDFAKYILEAFLESGAKAKDKYIMCLAGLLGNEGLLDYLKKLFKDLFDNKRLKMAQYVINTIALIGTDKALRFIEFISRKYKRKASLAAAAIESLEIAADELGIDIYELSDRIIPDFGFDGLYKTIEVGNEEMRVFVANNFKLQFITEDNKVRKALPKAASPELKKEMKEIQKEIRDVNKAQKERLEQYMVLERRWSVDDWRKFYLTNPVMFIYASTLVWAAFDENEKLVDLFYVDEDASILNIEEDEIEINDNHKIGIIHPLRMNKDQRSTWTQQFYDLEIMQPFEQLNRPAFIVLEEEVDLQNLERYDKKKAAVGPRAVQGYFEKRGWRKEVADAGCFTFNKEYKKENIYAHLDVNGLCIGYYEEEVEFFKIVFKKIGDYSWQSKGMKLKEIPEIAFSETVADMEGMKFKEGDN